MSSSQLRESSAGSSLEDYDKLFDAHNTLKEEQRTSSSHRLPLGEDGYDEPRPYDRDDAQLDFNEHHSAAYYPHVHQTLKSSDNRRRRKKKDRDSAYKKRKGSRPSQLFQPSLQEVAEQDHEHHGAETDEAGRKEPAVASQHGSQSSGPDNINRVVDDSAPLDEPVDLSQERFDNSSISSASMSRSSTSALPADEDNVVFTVGGATDQDSLDGGPILALPKHMASLVKGNNSAPGQLHRSNNSNSSTEPVKFQIGGGGSQVTVVDDDSLAAISLTDQGAEKEDHNVTFVVGGGESTDNFQHKREAGAVPSTSSPPNLARSRSTEGETSNSAQRAHLMKHRSHSYQLGDDLALRRCRGSDVELSDLPNRMMTSITTPEEAALLNRHDLEELATHRFERLRGYGKHKINKRSIAAKMSGLDGTEESAGPRVISEVTPHELFVELDELVTQQHNETTDFMEWKEKARWIKFEEDVIETSDRWGRPHVASLSFHSLIELRRLIENGVVQVDVDAHDYVSLMRAVIDELTIRRDLPEEQQEYAMQALILRHSHLDGKHRFARTKSYGNLLGLESMTRHSRYSHFFGSSKANNVTNRKPKKGGAAGQFAVDIPLDESDNPLIRRNSKSYGANLDKERYNMELLKKIPADAEVASVLVGTLKDLKKPCTVLFRLKHGVMLEHVAEVPLPFRFLFVCIGPPLPTVEYLEIGRSLSTLMSNQDFREAAYKAKGKSAILNAMNAFLDESIVLPPGDFDKRTLLPIMHMARKTIKARKNRQKAENDTKPGEVDLPGTDTKAAVDPLERTGRPFGGLVNDIKRKAPQYLSDFKDGLNTQVIAAFIFIYFACLSPAITFGGLLGEKTDNYMGASEMLMATAVSGIIFSLLGGQPLLIAGFTGPNMVFEEGVYKFSKNFDIDLLTWRFWIGVWVFIFAIILVATEASFLVKYVTRFTQEIFAFLISMIFIYEVLVKLIKVFKEHPLCEDYDECLARLVNSSSPSPSSVNPLLANASNSTRKNSITTMLPSNITTTLPSNDTTTSWVDMTTESLTTILIMQPNTALLTMSLTLFTFVIAYALKGMRNKKVLGRTIRRALGDFGVPLSILIMCVLDYVIGDRVYTQKLDVPPKFSVTAPEKRDWLINPLGDKSKPFPPAHIFSAILPALLASILIFMESLIAGVIVDKKENKLRKGSGYNLDILVLGFIALICGMLGVPFVCLATVRSVAHTSALTVISKNHAPGERPKLEMVIEQRLSNLLVHVLIAVSMFLGVVLRYIPSAVLFGVFLYMGIASLGGIQLFERIILLLTPKKHHPLDIGYTRYVRDVKMHLYTIIQIICVGVLWAVKLSPGALAFPFILVLLVPLRLFVLPRFYKSEELYELDRDDDCRVLVAADDEELDFYDASHMPD